VLLVAAVFAAYQPVWQAGFIWDDDAHVTRPELRSVDGLWRIWTDLKATQQYYPLVHSAFWVQYHLFGLNPLGYHLVNVALHAANALLVWCLLRRLAIPGAVLAAAVFALHPVMVESVAWVSELKNTLSGLFYMTAALVYLRFDQSRRKRWYALALGLFVLALLSKTVTASLPAALLVVFWWQRGRLTWRRDVAPLLPWFGLGAAAGLTTAWVERTLIGASGSDFEFTLLERGLIAGRVVWFYLGKLLWPVELIFMYPRWDIRATDPRQYVYPLLAIGLLVAAWQARRRSRAPLAALLFFGGTLFPALGFFNVFPFQYSFVADHFQYLASLGIIALAAGGLATARARWRPAATGQALVWAGALLALLGTLTWRQARIYHDLEMLWRDTLAKNPACWMAHNNLSVCLTDHGRFPEAVEHGTEALSRRPNYAEAHNNLGVALAEQGKLTEAMEHYTEALRLSPHYAEAHNNLGNALVKLGRVDEAIARFTEALRLNPDSAEAHCNLGRTLAAQGKLAEGIEHYTEALRLKPEYANAHGLLGAALAHQGKLPEAIDHLRHALRLQPSARTHYNLGVALAAQGQTTEAIDHYTEAVRLEPDYAEAHNNLGKALAAQGRLTAALGHYTAAVQADPNFADAYVNRSNARMQLGQPAVALADCRAVLRLQPDAVPTLNNVAWIQATADDSALRDGTEAVRHAERAVALSGRRVPEYLDTLAAAYAEAGRWQEAVATADEAVAVAQAAGQSELAAQIAARRERYRAGQPWRVEAE
jgi:tetratricopeptide (TPR) repeat protein